MHKTTANRKSNIKQLHRFWAQQTFVAHHVYGDKNIRPKRVS